MEDYKFNFEDIISEYNADEHKSAAAVHRDGNRAPGGQPRSESIPCNTAPEPPATVMYESKKRLPFLSFVLLIPVLVLITVWLISNVSPNVATVATVNEKLSVNVASSAELAANNLKSDALSDLVYIRKRYSLPENTVAAPMPDPSCYGETEDPYDVMQVIAAAAELLEGQDVVFDPEADFYPGSTIQYYRDDTILSIVWKEIINNSVYTLAETRIADGSQLRRALAGNSYGSSIQLAATEMSKTVNAVTATSGDYYSFRNVGIVVYDRRLERFSPIAIDSCFMTASGDMLFAYAGQYTYDDEDEVREFIADNDVLFSLAFGPVMVDGGEVKLAPQYSFYPIGEIYDRYSRSAIGLVDTLHYLSLVTTTEYDGVHSDQIRVYDAACAMRDKGCQKAYALDGGQTGCIIFKNTLANNLLWKDERLVSDILYFATAIPEEDWK